MEKELRLRRGEWPSVWPEEGSQTWKVRLVYLTNKLASAKEAVEEDARSQMEKAQKQQDQAAANRQKAEERLSKLKDHTTSAALTAKFNSCGRT